MSVQELKRLARKYYGYIFDMEGSGVEIMDMLFVRDKIWRILDQSLPEDKIPTSLYEHLHELDRLLWEERETFLMVIGEQELKYARQQHHSPRSHWWWYLDELQRPPQPLKEQYDRLAQAFRGHWLTSSTKDLCLSACPVKFGDHFTGAFICGYHRCVLVKSIGVRYELQEKDSFF